MHYSFETEAIRTQLKKKLHESDITFPSNQIERFLKRRALPGELTGTDKEQGKDQWDMIWRRRRKEIRPVISPMR